MTESIEHRPLVITQAEFPGYLLDRENVPLTTLVADLSSDAFVDARTRWLDDSLNGDYDGAIRHVDRLKERSDAVLDQAEAENLRATFRRVDDIRELMRRTFGEAAVAEHRHLKDAKWAMPKGDILFWGDDAKKLFTDIVVNSPAIDDGIDREHMVPPTKRENPERQDYLEYLGAKYFTEARGLFRSTRDTKRIKLEFDEPVQVPVRNIVSAGSFDSWQGRDTQGQGDKAYTKSSGEHVTGRSINAIIDYASRSTELPPIEGMTAFVQPNGLVIYVSPFGHRVAAAIARGQDTVSVKNGITVIPITYNVIEKDRILQSEAAK